METRSNRRRYRKEKPEKKFCSPTTSTAIVRFTSFLVTKKTIENGFEFGILFPMMVTISMTIHSSPSQNEVLPCSQAALHCPAIIPYFRVATEITSIVNRSFIPWTPAARRPRHWYKRFREAGERSILRRMTNTSHTTTTRNGKYRFGISKRKNRFRSCRIQCFNSTSSNFLLVAGMVNTCCCTMRWKNAITLPTYVLATSMPGPGSEKGDCS
mmetsp:Transcript_24755/g.26626  ORF Transcript_24755/g.26626 Transcript_24755/m.26626 type:complete len:213 (-) Transcript_24755:200-838(-)